MPGVTLDVTLCECFARDGLQHEPQFVPTGANVKAGERAVADLDAGYGANELSLLVSATESHTQRNLNRTRAGQWQNIAEMVAAADGRFRLVGTISVAFGCPFE